MEIAQLFDLIIKAIGLMAILIAVFQLFEAKKKRMVEMYWDISKTYSSEEMQESRRALSQITKELPLLNEYLEGRATKAGLKERVIGEYIARFHNADDTSKQRQMDIKARTRMRFLNQVGVLVRKKIIDKDLVLTLIGPGFEIDYPILEILIESYRKAHDFPKLYSGVDFLYEEYLRWKNA